MRSFLCSTSVILLFACSVAIAKGPVGLGDLELGMTKDRVEAISSESSVHLTSPLSLYEDDKPSSADGPDVYMTTIQSPIDSSPLRAALMFTDGQLSSIHIYFEDKSKTLENAKDMISSKYGEPELTDSMTEEQCINRNGTNYKIKSGKIRYSWFDSSPELGYVETVLIESVLDSCSMVKYAGGAIKSKKMVITLRAHEPTKAENPF